MTDTVFCRSCGEPLAGDSNFCEHCGAKLETRERERRFGLPKVTGEMLALDRVEALAPGTADLASQVAEQLRTPTVTTALAGGGLAAAVTFGIALILGLVLPDHSTIGLVDQGKGVITAGFAQMVNFLQVGYGDGIGKLGPALFLAFPIGACAVGAATQARRTLGLALPIRLASGAGVGFVFGLLMLIPALGVGGLGGGQNAPEPNALSAVVLGALWGALGGLIGTYYIVRPALQPGTLAGLAPARVREVSRTLYVALRPLVLLLGLLAIVGTLSWTVETLLESNLREGNSTPVAVIDHAAYAVEHGVHWTELAGLAQFQLAGADAGASGVPVPIGDISKLKTNSTGRYRLFGFSHAMPIYTFAPMLILLLGSALLLAFSAGAAIAQSQLPATPWAAAAWGCLVGPIWALAMVIINALVTKEFFGRASGDSIFGAFLLGGLIVGAIGGLTSGQARRKRTPGDGDTPSTGVRPAAGPGAREREGT
jgi:hypothetical protein